MQLSQWCSTSNRQGNCAPSAGVCKPMDHAALALFKRLQEQLNRALYVLGKSTIAVDGRIGSGTLKAVNTVLGTSYTSCDQIAATVEVVIGTIESRAATLQAPITVPSPKPPAPSIPMPDGSVQNPTAAAGFIGFIKSPLGIAVGLATLGALYAISRDTPRS